jgi:hypothetical protein
MKINISKVKSSYNTLKAYAYNSLYDATFSLMFNNDVTGILALNDFVKMIKSRYCIDTVKIIIEKNEIDYINPALLSDLYNDIE